MTWTVYAIEVEGRYEYIGIAKDTYHRTHEHKAGIFHGVDFRMVPLETARTKPSARKKEARLIRKHRPPKNIQHMGSRPYQTVKALKYTSGGWIEWNFRLHPGVMHPDQAREIWHRSKLLKSGAVLKRMPGWTLPKASFMFGARQMVGAKGTIR